MDTAKKATTPIRETMLGQSSLVARILMAVTLPTSFREEKYLFALSI